MAMTMSTPREKARSCGTYDMPPAISTVDRPAARASGSSASLTCMASSRVGTSTRPRGGLPVPPVRLAIIGRPKASVLPDPVWPRPSTSRPAMASGIVAAWIGNGVVMPWPSRMATMLAGTPRSANVPSKAGVGVVGSMVTSSSSGSRSASRSRGGRTLLILGADAWCERSERSAYGRFPAFLSS